MPWHSGRPGLKTATPPGRPDVADTVDEVLPTLTAVDLDPVPAAVPVVRASVRPAPTPAEPWPAGAARVFPSVPETAGPDDGPVPTAAEPSRAERVAVSLALVVGAVAARRLFPSIRPRDVRKIERPWEALRRC